jgi:hypothetical protein
VIHGQKTVVTSLLLVFDYHARNTLRDFSECKYVLVKGKILPVFEKKVIILTNFWLTEDVNNCSINDYKNHKIL